MEDFPAAVREMGRPAGWRGAIGRGEPFDGGWAPPWMRIEGERMHGVEWGLCLGAADVEVWLVGSAVFPGLVVGLCGGSRIGKFIFIWIG